MKRGALMTIVGHLTSLARPIAVACVSRRYGAQALGTFLLVWTCVEIGARLATLGLDRGLQRWSSDSRRLAATIGGIFVAALTGVGVALGIDHVLSNVIELDTLVMSTVRPLLLIGIPLSAASNVALRAPKGEAQIGFYVLARGVTEPMLLLVAGLGAMSLGPGPSVLPTVLLLSIVGSSAVALATVGRTFGARSAALTLLRPNTWPLRELVRPSLPLGISELLLTVQAKLDLIAVALATFSTQDVAAYAIAAEVAAVLAAIRTGVDQVVAPFAAEARADRPRLARILATATRWSFAVALIVVLAVIAAPSQWLRWFGGVDAAAPILLVLLLGRAVDLVVAPSASVVAMVGAPTLPLLSTTVGLSIALVGEIACVAAHAPMIHIAIVSTTAVVVASLLQWKWAR